MKLSDNFYKVARSGLDYLRGVCFFAASASCLAAFGLTDVYWVNSSGGDWNDALNWSGAVVPNSADCHVKITNEVPVTISLGSADFTIGGLSFSGANHVINGASANSGFLKFSGGKALPDVPVIEVPEGVVATIPAIRAASDSNVGLSKKGGGVLVAPGYFGFWGKFSVFEIESGIVSNTYAGSGNNIITFGSAIIRGGARMVVGADNKIDDTVIFQLDEGSVLDFGNKRDGIGGVCGYGVVTNMGGTATQFNSGPLEFAGRIHGPITLNPSSNYVTGDCGYLRVGSADTLADATVELKGSGSFTNVLRFAPGVGSFNVKQLSFGQAFPVVLEDTDGGPVTLKAGFVAGCANARFVGRGNFVKSNGNTWTITNDLYSATGMLGLAAGTIEAGKGTEGFDATSLADIARLDVGSGATFKMKNYADTAWNVPVTGAGTVRSAGPGVWTLNDFSLTNGTLAVDSPAAEIVLAGGASTNVAYSVVPTKFKTKITGGDHSFAGVFNVSADRTVEQTGGNVRCCLQASSSSCSNDIFYVISGGSLVSYASRSINNYPQGIGIDISGDAHVELRHESGYSYLHRIASGNASHTLRISDNAYLGMDDIVIIGEYTSTATAVLDLQGGVVEMKGVFNVPSGENISAPAEGKILFNGGVLRAVNTGNQTWWNSSTDPDERVKAYIGAAGAIIDVRSSVYNKVLTVNWPTVSGVSGGVDGGLLKLGFGQLKLMKPYTATGLVDVREGSIDVPSGMGATPFGTANVQIGGGLLKFASGSVALNAAEGASLAYTNCATLNLSGGTALTIGPAGAAADSAIARRGHGVLEIRSGTQNSALGVNSSVTVNGGLSTDASTGILRQPIFECRQVSGSVNQYRARFLTCDANNALVPAATVAFDPASSTSATVAEITSSAATVSADASVGALNVEFAPKGSGLTVASGVTLHVGSGNAGSIAPILLNNVSSGGSSGDSTAISGGGTIDFGASEGVIVVNGNAGIQYPMQIEAAIAGSGGITFAAPMLTLSNGGFRGFVALTKAGSYTGGTWIENVHVRASAAGCFGSGTVHVLGSGVDDGALEIAPKYNSNTFANPLVLAGNGPLYPEDNGGMPGYLGALIVRKGGVTFTGGVTLAADARIVTGSRGGQKPVVFSAPITGPGCLTASGSSPLRFDAANTYAGGTVISNGVIEVTDAGSFGTGPVKICRDGVLRFVNTSPKTVENVITGDGRIEMNGAALMLSAADGFTGDVTGSGSAAGDDGYVKSGEGTVAFTNALDYTGATTVEAGTLRLGFAPIGVPPASESITFRLDASASGSITEEEGAITSWADADGRGITFVNAGTSATMRVSGALNDMDVVRFDKILVRLIANDVTPKLCTVLFVNRVATTHPNNNKWSNMGILGKANADFGLRFLDRTRIKADSMFLDGVIHVNGSSVMTSGLEVYDQIDVPNNTFVVIAAEASVPVQNVTFALGDYWGADSQKRSYSGDIAEVVAYDRWLTEEERVAAERYLQNKWGLKEFDESVCSNVLPVATALTVAEGAVLDLAGGWQEVASLSGGGVVTNSSSTRATLRLSSGASTFTGAFGGDIYLEVAAGVTLDLGGGTLTVAGIGGAGSVVNGTVVVTDEICPGGRGAVGTLTFETAPVVAGATLVIEGDGIGAVDALAVASDFDMAGLALSVPAQNAIAPGDHAVVVSGGIRSGVFASTDLPNGGRLSLNYTATAAVLSRRTGLLLMIK